MLPETSKSFDELVTDTQARRECGDVTEMTTWRWDRDPTMIALGWPPPIYLNRRKYRSRRLLEEFKRNLLARAMKARNPATTAAR